MTKKNEQINNKELREELTELTELCNAINARLFFLKQTLFASPASETIKELD